MSSIGSEAAAPAAPAPRGSLSSTRFLLPFRLARRELRGSKRGLKTFLACLALGVAAIAGSSSVNLALKESLADDAQSLLGGDLQARLTHRTAAEDEQATLEALGVVSRQIEMRSMARIDRPEVAEGRTRSLIELKAVDGRYPLYGDVALSRGDLDAALAYDGNYWGAAVDPILTDRLGLSVGEHIRVGDAVFVVRALIEREPDRVATFASFGPRVLVALPAMDSTGLVQNGSLVRFVYNVKLAPEYDFERAAARLKAAHPDAGWRLRGLEQAVQGFADVLDNVTLFFNLAGLTTLLVGGIGVANAVRAYLESRVQTIAALKCLGASGGLVFATYAVQVAVLAAAGIAVGVLLGASVPVLVERFFGAVLPGTMSARIFPRALAHAATFGAMTTAVFALWPLAVARQVPAALLVRGTMTLPDRVPRARDTFLIAAVAAGLVAYTVLTAETTRVAVGFVAGALTAVVLLRLAAGAIMRLARALGAAGSRWVRGRPGLRLALANLHRPGAVTVSVVLSLGLGLTVLVAVALIEANLKRQIVDRLPADAPSYFFLDIQPDQVAAFEDVVAEVGGVEAMELAPMIRGRIVEVGGTPVAAAEIDPEVDWAFRGDRGLSFTAKPLGRADVVAGAWWPSDYRGPNLVSMDADIARGAGLEVGDTITMNVLGRDIEAEIANLREIKWQTAQMNFTFVYNPAALAGAPVTYIATVHAGAGRERAIEDRIVEALPNVTAISVAEAIERVNGLLSTAAAVIRAIAAVALIAGVFVLTSAIAAGHMRRVYEAVVLKVLGGTRRDIFKAFLFEYALLGAATGVFAVLAGALGAWSVMRFVMRGDWHFSPGVAAVIVAVGILLTFASGFAGVFRALGAKSAPFLRNE